MTRRRSAPSGGLKHPAQHAGTLLKYQAFMTCTQVAQYSMTPKRPLATPSCRPGTPRFHLPLAALLLALSLAPSAQAQESLFPTAKPAETTLTQAGQLERNGRYTDALAKVEQAIQEEPDQPRPRFLKGVILMDLKRLDEAAAEFQGLRENFPELPEPYNNLAVIRMLQGHFEEAKNLLEIAVLAHPGYTTAHENLGDVYARLAGEEYNRAGASRKFQTIRDLIAPQAAVPGTNAPNKPLSNPGAPAKAAPSGAIPSGTIPDKASPDRAATDKASPAAAPGATTTDTFAQEKLIVDKDLVWDAAPGKAPPPRPAQ